MSSIKQYVCHQCGSKFSRYACMVTGVKVFCNRDCHSAYAREHPPAGKLNPNYRHGGCCKPSFCACGREKDYRAARCSRCSKRGFVKGTSKQVDGERVTELACGKAALERATARLSTYKDVAAAIGIKRATAKKYISLYQFSTQHFTHVRYRPYNKHNVADAKHVLGAPTLRRVLVQDCGVPNECSVCGQATTWGGKPLQLQVRHISGNRADNRISNLQLLCPNCHSQTPNYTGRKIKGVRKPRKSGHRKSAGATE